MVNGRLELTWIGKDERPRLEPRILLEDPSVSHHAARRVTDRDVFDNMLIQGDNLLALKALERDFTGAFRCVFIDPPYNTGSAFQQYDDGVEHSLWLSLMRDRLELIRTLLREDGSLWISIDDNESHYLKVLCDEVFGRQNFVSNVIWEKKSAAMPNARWISDCHDHILVYAANKPTWRPLKLQRTAEVNEKYNQSDEHDGVRTDGTTYGRGPWFADNLTASLRSGQRGKQFARTGESPNVYEVVTPSGRSIALPAGTCWRVSSERLRELTADKRITYGKNGSSRPCLKRFLSEMADVGLTAKSVWRHDEVGENRHATNEAKKLNSQTPFATPKPEGLIHRVLSLSTEPGDLVLDSFAGSGTTGAVAHKMGRRWIMVELGEHALSHIVPRMCAVIDGTDAGGVSERLQWRGGGGFRFYRMAPSLLERDKWGNWVVSKKYNGPMLAEALCKLEGFRYAPDATDFWIHGRSSASDYIYVTDQRLNSDQLQYLSDRVGPDRTLLVCCRAWRGKVENYPNLTLKKIPQAVLGKCEWGRDDYSLNIRDLPVDQANAECEGQAPAPASRRRRHGAAVQDLPLFAKTKTGGDA